MVSTRLRCRLFKPWMEKPCSRVLRKLSGELTTIQYWALRAAPDLRLRRERPDLPGRSGWVWGGASTCSSDTEARLLAVDGRARRAQVLRLGHEGAEVADLGDVADLVPGHQAADVEQGHLAAARVGEIGR